MIGRRTSGKRRFLSGAPVAPAALRRLASSPLAWIVGAQSLLRLAGIGWGLPGSDGWDNDGVAPRDCLAGIVATFTPGQYFRYPPVHLAALSLLDLPVVGVALLRARSLAPPDVVREIIAVPYMTVVSVVARVVSVAMAGGIAWALAKIAEEIRGRRAGLWAAAFAGLGVPVVYYGQTSNLDVPYLFWGCIALLGAVRAVARQDPSLLKRAAVFAALAIGTKDQAYGLFLLAVPVGLGLCAAFDGATWGRGTRGPGEVLRAAAIGVATLAVVDGPLYNPEGSVRRLAYLTGPASAPFSPYSAGAAGQRALLGDLAARFVSVYPLAFVVPVVAGLVAVAADRQRGSVRRLAGAMPVLVLASFTLTFNCVARRADHRFVLPQAAMLGVYGGIGADAILGAARGAVARRLAQVALIATLAWATYRAADVEANLLLDPRYDAEDWMRAHVAPGDRIETYGLNTYLPRMPAGAKVLRVGREPAASRSPMPGVEEVEGPFGGARARGARFLVVPEAWAGRYLVDPAMSLQEGETLASSAKASTRELDACRFFRALNDEPATQGYRLAHAARWSHPWWPALDLHASTARPVAIYEREGN